MSFQKEYNSKKNQLWLDYYFDYDLCYEILIPLQVIYHKKARTLYKNEVVRNTKGISLEEERLSIASIHSKDFFKDYEKSYIYTRLKEQLRLELLKVNTFYEEVLKRLKLKFDDTRYQMEFAKLTGQFKAYREIFDMAMKELFKECTMIYEYVNLNKSAIKKIVYKYEKYISSFQEDNPIAIKPFYKQQLSELAFKDAEDEIEKFIDQVHETFSFHFHEKGKDYIEYYKELNNYLKNEDISITQSFYLGILLGMLLFQILIIVVVLMNYSLDIDKDVEFSSVFPLFRGFAVICLYWWLMGFTIYIWKSVKINYKLIFEITGNNIKVVTIYKQAAFFSFLFLGSLIFYILGRAKINLFYGLYIPINLLPLIFWVSFLVYVFCPFEFFQTESRTFVFDLINESLLCWLSKPTFRNSWLIGNMTSFIGPMRDLEYSICYYAYYGASIPDKNFYCRKSRGIYLAIAFFPHIIKILTVIRGFKFNSKDKPIKTSQKLGLFKHCLSLVTSTLSFMTPHHPWCFYVWLVCTIFSACLSFSIDIKVDFGLLSDKGFPLREKRLFKHDFVYYFISVVDIILRFGWLLNLSPEIIKKTLRPNTISLILFSLEIFRRSLWNILRIEYKHLETSAQYFISPDIELPFIMDKEKGHLVVNEANLVSIIGLSREDTIIYEIKKMYVNKKEMAFKGEKNYTPYYAKDGEKTKGILDDYLKEYKRKTENNLKAANLENL